jgi:hypothetical protein
MRTISLGGLLLFTATLGACSSAVAGSSADPERTPMRVEPTTSSTPLVSSQEVASNDVPSRVVIPALRIDLPIVSGDVTVAGNPPDYPLCDVAQYLTTYRFPGHPGTTTWIYAHARDGMFLPILDASTKDNGASLIGVTVDVYSTGLRRYTYRITAVHRHAVDRSAAAAVPAGQRRLVLQTSEGPHGTVPKLQVSAELVGSSPASRGESMPGAAPRGCAV